MRFGVRRCTAVVEVFAVQIVWQGLETDDCCMQTATQKHSQLVAMQLLDGLQRRHGGSREGVDMQVAGLGGAGSGISGLPGCSGHKSAWLHTHPDDHVGWDGLHTPALCQSELPELMRVQFAAGRDIRAARDRAELPLPFGPLVALPAQATCLWAWAFNHGFGSQTCLALFLCGRLLALHVLTWPWQIFRICSGLIIASHLQKHNSGVCGMTAQEVVRVVRGECLLMLPSCTSLYVMAHWIPTARSQDFDARAHRAVQQLCTRPGLRVHSNREAHLALLNNSAFLLASAVPGSSALSECCPAGTRVASGCSVLRCTAYTHQRVMQSKTKPRKELMLSLRPW